MTGNRTIILDCPVEGCEIKIVVPCDVRLLPGMVDAEVTVDFSVFHNHFKQHKLVEETYDNDA